MLSVVLFNRQTKQTREEHTFSLMIIPQNMDPLQKKIKIKKSRAPPGY